ncbi:MAG: DUF5318 family protein [Acidimicrobiia bacterium]|nr:DUF5318 family protein [Acidimicrobiia bacterium]
MQSDAPDGLGWIDYTMARRSVLGDLACGRVSRTEVCDCHPELMRVARYQGEPAETECPVCHSDANVTVTFAFGDRLARRNGRMIPPQEIEAYVAVPGVSCYTVEVCTDCSWNHLLRSHGAVTLTHDAGAVTRILKAAEPSRDTD